MDVRTINYHLKKIFEDAELQESSVIQDFWITAVDGKNYNTKHYNLDLIQSGDTKAVININGKEIALSKFKAGHRNDRGNKNLRILHELEN